MRCAAPLPGDALGAIPPRHSVAEQCIKIPASWWKTRLAEHDAPGGQFQDNNGHLTRADVWRHGSTAADDGDAAATLLWHALAWGTGAKPRHCRRRVSAVSRTRDTTLNLLAEAAALAKSDPVGAYRLLHPRHRRSTIHGLGPAFGTKFLYFAGGGNPTHPCLILDSRVASALRLRGWEAFPYGRWWPETYGQYCELLRCWANELSSPDQAVHPDQVEFWLFRAGR
jgi:hypothetical protein